MEETVTCQDELEESTSEIPHDKVITKAVEQLSKDDQFLDIGRQQLISFPEDLYMYCENLKFLYLEGNLLESLPDNLFPSLPQLRWLDARNNLLKELPRSVAHHRSLEVLLLQRNQLSALPLELGLVPKLRGLQLAGNPLQVPPADVVRNGMQAVLSYLREQVALGARSPPAVRPVEKLIYKDSKKDSACKVGGGGQKLRRSAASRGRRSVRVPRPKAKSADLPAISVRGFRCSRELVAPETTPVLTLDRQTPDFNTGDKFQHLNNFRSVEEKIFHLWPSASGDLLDRDKMELRVQEKYLKDVCVKKLKEMLQRQSLVLQRRSDTAVLKSWRKDTKSSHKTSAKKSVAPPYDTDPDYCRMLSRAEINNPAARQRRKKTSSARVGRSLDEEMEELLSKLGKPCVIKDLSPQAEQRVLQAEIHKLVELQRRLRALQIRNNTEGSSNTAARQ